MPFFDNLGKKVSNAGKSTLQKTKDFADVTRLNSQIAEEEKKINNCYYQIGKLYISLHNADYEEAFTGMVRVLCDSDAKIKEMRQQIMEIKGLRRCEKCGAEVASTVAFCNVCGNKMPVRFDDSMVRCESCGELMQKGTRFCTACGKPLSTVQAPVSSAPVETEGAAEETDYVLEEPANAPEAACPPEEPVAAPAGPVCCPNCGAPVQNDSAFCTQCGTKL